MLTGGVGAHENAPPGVKVRPTPVGSLQEYDNVEYNPTE